MNEILTNIPIQQQLEQFILEQGGTPLTREVLSVFILQLEQAQLATIEGRLRKKIAFIQERSDQVVVITGPSGVGKGTTFKYLQEKHGFREAPYVTTRLPIRPGEVENGSYHIPQEDLFIAEGTGKLFMIVTAYGNTYAYDIDVISELLASGQKLLMEAPPNRIAGEVTYLLPNATIIGLIPEDETFTTQTLQQRGTESSSKQAIRVTEGKADTAHCRLLAEDGIITLVHAKYGNVDHTVSQVASILELNNHAAT